MQEEQSKVEHRDRQGGQEEGALSFCSPGCSTSLGHGIPNTGTCSSPLSTLGRCVCAEIRALMDEPKMGDRSLWGALHPSRWHRILGRELAADPGSSKGRKNSFIARGLGLRATGSKFRQHSSAERACTDSFAFWERRCCCQSLTPSRKVPFPPLLMVYLGRSLIFH